MNLSNWLTAITSSNGSDSWVRREARAARRRRRKARRRWAQIESLEGRTLLSGTGGGTGSTATGTATTGMTGSTGGTGSTAGTGSTGSTGGMPGSPPDTQSPSVDSVTWPSGDEGDNADSSGTTSSGMSSGLDLALELKDNSGLPLTINVDWGDSSSSSTTVSPDFSGTSSTTFDYSATLNHSWGDDGPWAITVTITDDAGNETTTSSTITLNNVDPEVCINGCSDSTSGSMSASVSNSMSGSMSGSMTGSTGGSSSSVWTVAAGDEISLNGWATDAGWDDDLTMTIDWDGGGTEPTDGAGGGGGAPSPVTGKPDLSEEFKWIYDEAGDFNITLDASDDDGGQATDQLAIRVIPKIALQGDLFAVEGPNNADADRAELYVRSNVPINRPGESLLVDLKITYQTAEKEDFYESHTTLQSLFIPHGQTISTTPLKFTARDDDAASEPIQKLTVEVLGVRGAYQAPDEVHYRDGSRGDRIVTVTVLGGVTLFGEYLQLPPGNQKDMNDATPAQPVKIHYNDVNQGGVSNCFLHAAIGSLARHKPEKIEGLFSEITEENVKVTLNIIQKQPDGTIVITGTKEHEIPMKISAGVENAQLSGDYDEEGLTEIWTLILEEAYNRHVYWMSENTNAPASCNSVAQAMAILTGSIPKALYRNPPDGSNSPPLQTMNPNDLGFTIWSRFYGNENTNPPIPKSSITMGTVDIESLSDELDDADLKLDHAYVVIGYRRNGTPGDFSDDEVQLFNPHNSDDPAQARFQRPWVSISEIKALMDAIWFHAE